MYEMDNRNNMQKEQFNSVSTSETSCILYRAGTMTSITYFNLLTKTFKSIYQDKEQYLYCIMFSIYTASIKNLRHIKDKMLRNILSRREMK